MNELLDQISKEALSLLNVNHIYIRLLDNEGLLRTVAVAGRGVYQGNMVGRGRTSSSVMRNQKPVVIRDIRQERSFEPEHPVHEMGVRGFLAVPLISRDRKSIGVLGAATLAEREFTQQEITLAEQFAAGAAIAIENSKLYEESRRQAAELEGANRVKDEFLSVMSHELRTPLVAIMGYTELMEMGHYGEPTPEMKGTLGKVIGTSKNLVAMIDSMLQATKIESGALIVSRQEINPCDLLDDLKFHCYVPIGKQLSLICDYPRDLPVMLTDGEKLKQILQNLVQNAIKFTDQGTVSVLARTLDEHEIVEFQVCDTGIGITKENLSVIFDMFRQVDSSNTRPHGGVGLGLYIVKKLTELLGGRVEVESEPGRGSTFSVRVPVSSPLNS
jgi:signal transduction histidine kinase